MLPGNNPGVGQGRVNTSVKHPGQGDSLREPASARPAQSLAPVSDVITLSLQRRDNKPVH